MRFSIVIAAHNEGEALWRTVRSCVETCGGPGGGTSDYEIVIADDASWDGSVEEVERRFPRVRTLRNPERLGPSPTKDRGARAASGEVLVFLDGHAKPEPGALPRLVDDVQRLGGRAVATPTIVWLDVARWRNAASPAGHGYRADLEDFRGAWLPLSGLRVVREGPRTFYESPAAIGCALAVSRELYETLWGFDPDMRSWGVEDVDFGLKCWLMGFPILHDPEAVVGHRFQSSFDNYEVPREELLANRLRLARKNFTPGVWEAWVERARERNDGPLPGRPEGLWAAAWQLFESRRASAEQERAYLLARRERDEFWYAQRFGLDWPKLAGAGDAWGTPPAARLAATAQEEPFETSPGPSEGPSPGPDPDPEPDPECDCPQGEDDDQGMGCDEERDLMEDDGVYWDRPLPGGGPDMNWFLRAGDVWEVRPKSGNPLAPAPGGPGSNRNSNSIGTKCHYSDFHLSFEFRCPNMKTDFKDCSSTLEGPQNWGNSGVKILNPERGYEVQIMDSFGFSTGTPPKIVAVPPAGAVVCAETDKGVVRNGDLCGAIYHTRGPAKDPGLKPAINYPDETLSLGFRPVGAWNTMDIWFMSARYEVLPGGTFKRVKCCTISVQVNGHQVQYRVGLDPTSKWGFDETANLVCDTFYDEGDSSKGYCKARGPILLQEHDTPVQFRLIKINPRWRPGTDWQKESDCLKRTF